MGTGDIRLAVQSGIQLFPVSETAWKSPERQPSEEVSPRLTEVCATAFAPKDSLLIDQTLNEGIDNRREQDDAKTDHVNYQRKIAQNDHEVKAKKQDIKEGYQHERAPFNDLLNLRL